MPEIVHNIDLSAVPHRLGQSTDLEPKRLRAWARLSDEEKEWVINAWDLTGMIPTAPAFRELQNASDRVLYVLVGTEESLTPTELSYLMIARWFRNIDAATARAKMAQLVNQGFARYTGIGRTMATEPGLEKLEDLASPMSRSRDDDDDEPGRSDHRQTSSRTRIVDRGESPRSTFGDYSAPKGKYRHELDSGAPSRDDRGPRRDDRCGDSRASSRDDRGGYSRGPSRDDLGGDSRGLRRDDRGGYSRGPSRDDRGGDSRGPRGDDRGGYSRGPSRDDRGGDSRGSGRDDRGGYSRGPRRDDRGGDSRSSGRDDRGGYSRGPRRDDRGGDSRGPRRDDRGGYSRGPRRDDRGSDSRGPSRDDRGGYSRGPRRNDRSGAPERGRINSDGPVIDGWTPDAAADRGRVNTDGPVIDGRDRSEQRVNTDGPVIDGRDKESKGEGSED